MHYSKRGAWFSSMVGLLVFAALVHSCRPTADNSSPSETRGGELKT